MNWEFQAATLRATLPAEATMESALKQMRLMWMLVLAAAFGYVALAEFLPHSVAPIKREVYAIILVVGVMELVSMVIVRKVLLTKAEDVLRTSPSDMAAIFRWRQGQVITLAIASAIVMFGLVVRFIGATTIQEAPLYLLGLAAMLVFQPKAVQ